MICSNKSDSKSFKKEIQKKQLKKNKELMLPLNDLIIINKT